MGTTGIHRKPEVLVVTARVVTEQAPVASQPVEVPRNGSARPPGLVTTPGRRRRINWNSLMRTTHYWGSIAIALPLLVVISTGVLMLVKKQVPWVQPIERRGQAKQPEIAFDQMLKTVKRLPLAEVSSWSDIDRVDVRPSKGMAKVRAKNNWEVQLDTKTGELLQVAYRRYDLISSLHDGSWFHPAAKLWVFLPNAVIVLGLLLTGLYLFVLPFWAKARAKARRAAAEQRHKSVKDVMATVPGWIAGVRDVATAPVRVAQWGVIVVSLGLLLGLATAVWILSPRQAQANRSPAPVQQAPGIPRAGDPAEGTRSARDATGLSRSSLLGINPGEGQGIGVPSPHPPKDVPAPHLTPGIASGKEALGTSALPGAQEPSPQIPKTESIPQKPVRPHGQIQAPTSGRKAAALAPVARAPSAPRQEMSRRGGESPAPTAIIDWLLRQSSAADRGGPERPLLTSDGPPRLWDDPHT